MLLNMSAQLTLPDGFHKSSDFVFFPGGQELDPAIAQIPHETGDIEPLCYLPDRITKTDALDISFVDNLDRGVHATLRLIRHFAGGNR